MSLFRTIVQKEIADHVRSWRFYILLCIMALTCIGSIYTVLMSIRDAVSTNQNEQHLFLFLKLFTVSDGTLPPFITFISFLGPLLGMGLGFDAVNSERNRGTLSRILAQPVPRDYVLNAKFVASLIMISIIFISLGLLVMGLGIVSTGIPPTPEEFLRLILFLMVSIVYVAFWLNLSIYFSSKFRQPATSALSSIAVWIFFSVFYNMIVNVIIRTMPQAASNEALVQQHETIQLLLRLSPSHLFSEATTTLLMPSVRSLGPLTMEQVIGAIPSPLPLGQSILLVWPQLTVLCAATLVCFGLSYVQFMRQEIRSRS